MRQKILKIIFVVFTVSVLCLSFAFTSFASAIQGFETYQPNMPDMNLIYVSEGYTTPNWRTLTGYYQFGGTKTSSQVAGNNSMKTYKQGENIGYEFDLYNKAEIYLDFIYLPIKTSASTAPSNTYFIEYYITGSMNDIFASVAVDVIFEVFYYDNNFTINSRRFTLTKTFEDGLYHSITLRDIIPISELQTVRGIKSISMGFDVSNKSYINGINGSFNISNATDYANYQPYLNAVSSLKNSVYSYAYSKGASDSSTNNADAIYQSGYEAGFNAGSNYGMGSNNTISQATLNYYYQTGYQEGLLVGNNQNALALKEKYNEGYSAGYDEGYAFGESDGYDKGYDSGMGDAELVYDESIFDEGYDAGYSVGYDDAIYDSDVAFNDGYTLGFQDGQADIIESEGLFSFITNSISSIFNMPLGEHFTLGGVLSIAIAIPILIACLKLFAGG